MTGPDLELYSVGRSDRALFGDRITAMLALSPVPFWGKDNMTVLERIRFLWVDSSLLSDARSAVFCGYPRGGSFCWFVMLWY